MLLLMAMLLMACGGSEEENSSIPEDEDCYLDIYVYAPDRPIVTRGDVGEIKARTEAESNVHTLQIWVFKSSNGDPVGYLNAGGNDEAYDVTGATISDPSILNEKGQQVYRMKVEKHFADNPEAVDVYVVANAASCGLTTLGKTTTRAQLNNAKIGSDYFGTTDLYGIDDLESGKRIYTNGLPMSAVLKNQPISGKFPALRIGSESQIATLHLTRAVSKLRFVLCRIKENASSNKKLVSIDEIQLNSGVVNTSCQIPTETYLMPGTYSYTNNYVSDGITYVSDTETGRLLPASIPQVIDPLAYAYETQDAQEYENLIDKAISGEALANVGDEKLKELGLTYLRESDKQLTGTITYTYNEDNSPTNTEKTVPFSMAAAGDFLRNHSWIIYIYYLDSKLYVLTVTHIGMRSWGNGGAEEHSIYNW